MKTITHLTQAEIEEAIVLFVREKRIGTDREREVSNAKIIVELGREETGDQRDQPFTVVKVIRAEVEST